MRYTGRGYYGRETAFFHSDTDFDIGDTYTIPANYKVHGVFHSHGSAQLEIYNGSAWISVYDIDGALYPGAGNEFRTVDGSPISMGGTNAGSLRMAGSGLDNSTLYVLMSYTERVAT